MRALARADRFVRVGAACADEVDTTDLDLALRAERTGDQWRRAEAAGLLRVAPEPVGEADAGPSGAQDRQLVPDPAFVDQRVWWDEEQEEWRTDFPPPAGF